MQIHEYQALALLRDGGVATPQGELAWTPEEARALAARFGGRAVVKAQVHAGGRGRAGGVRVAPTPEAAEAAFRAVMGLRLVSPQTGPLGRRVHRVWVCEAVEAVRELYVGALVDRASGRAMLLACAEGGVEIEEAARRHPEAVLRVGVDPALGLRPFQARRICAFLGLEGETARAGQALLGALYRFFLEKDCSLLEINPLALTAAGALVALDCRLRFDDNALLRHPELMELRDEGEETPEEREAFRAGLSYVRLEGRIGCLVNGAGLAMATMDLLQLCGASPANFLDVGGGAGEEALRRAFRILLQDRRLGAVLVNVFGGILRCDRVAAALVEVAWDLGLALPVVVRLQGAMAEEGRRILRESGLDLRIAEGFREAAELAVAALDGASPSA